ncbi:MAG TPA: hypothetical protein VJ941_04300 [Gracilimonas sp.]|nr:hypothetical protein [Gracilimonas sp.]
MSEDVFLKGSHAWFSKELLSEEVESPVVIEAGDARSKAGMTLLRMKYLIEHPY